MGWKVGHVSIVIANYNGGKTESVWACTEETWWVYWEKGADDGIVTKEETNKT